MVDLGDEIEVRVDDIDQQGKVSLSPVGDGDAAPAGGGGSRRRARARAGGASSAVEPARRPTSAPSSGATVSFEDRGRTKPPEFGDLGPADAGGGAAAIAAVPASQPASRRPSPVA